MRAPCCIPVDTDVKLFGDRHLADIFSNVPFLNELDPYMQYGGRLLHCVRNTVHDLLEAPLVNQKKP